MTNCTIKLFKKNLRSGHNLNCVANYLTLQNVVKISSKAKKCQKWAEECVCPVPFRGLRSGLPNLEKWQSWLRPSPLVFTSSYFLSASSAICLAWANCDSIMATLSSSIFDLFSRTLRILDKFRDNLRITEALKTCTRLHGCHEK